jgi:hypothetical protein
MSRFDYDLGPDRDLADLDGNGRVDAFEAALFFDEMEREDRAIERRMGGLWPEPEDDGLLAELDLLEELDLMDEDDF